LREENRQIKLDNAELIQRLNNHVHNIADLNNKVKAIEEEKASLLTVIQLLQPNCNDSKVDESNKRDTWSRNSRIRTNNNFRRNTPTLRNKDTANFNQYTVLPVHVTSEDDDKVIEIDNGAESSKGKFTTSPNGDPPKQKHFNISSKTNVQAQRNQSRRPRDAQSPKHKSQDQQLSTQ
jgi:hypothetical protein